MLGVRHAVQITFAYNSGRPDAKYAHLFVRNNAQLSIYRLVMDGRSFDQNQWNTLLTY